MRTKTGPLGPDLMFKSAPKAGQVEEKWGRAAYHGHPHWVADDASQVVQHVSLTSARAVTEGARRHRAPLGITTPRSAPITARRRGDATALAV